MKLSKDLISEFVKTTRDTVKPKQESIVYGTVKGTNLVQIDGAADDRLTPVSSTTAIEENDRVVLMIKNHSAVVTGNLDSQGISPRIGDVDARFNSVSTNYLTSEQANIKYATINNLNAQQARIDTLNTNKLSVSDAAMSYATIDFSNISRATMGQFYASSGLIRNVVVGDSTITGNLVGVTISGDLIEGNTVKADKLVIKGSDGIYYKLNTDGMKTEAQQTNQNSLDGGVIKAKSITATKVNVTDLVAFDATIGGFNITNSALYSGVKSSADNTTRGIYLGKDAQAAIGDSASYIKYYKDSNGNYKLDISADDIAFTSGTNLGTQLNDLSESVATNSGDLTTYIADSNSRFEQLQGQIDGSIMTWFYANEPSNNNEPAVDWNTDELKNNHLGDLYYDTDTGYCYRWQVQNGEYLWSRITDVDVTKALSDAAIAQDTADSKRRVFTTTPTTPYDVGDLWAQGGSGDIMRCKTAKTSSQSYTAADWEKASKYTDDTKATTAKNAADAAQADVDELKPRMTSAETQINQNSQQIELMAAQVDGDISALNTRFTSAESSLTILSNRISSNVTETTNLGTRMTTVEQTAEGLTASVSAAQKTATNFLSYDATNGLLIGNKTSGSWSGYRAQIKNSAFNILDSSGTVLSSYGTTTTIGKTSGNNIYIDGDSINIRRNGSVLATFDQYGLKIANTNDSSGSLGSGSTKPALIIGTPTGYHIEMDNNEIMAKSNATTSSHLFLNMEGGNVSFNNNANRAIMFQEGALYAKNSSFYGGEYLGILDALNDSGNTTLGYGGYINSIGGTNVYGNTISLISNSNVDVDASWINCRSIAPSQHATYALGVYGEKGWSNIYLGKGDNKTNALHIIAGTSTYLLCGVNSGGQYVFGNNAAIMYYQAKDVGTSNTGNAFKITSGNNSAANNTNSVWFFGGADATSRYIGSYMAYSRTYSAAANMHVTANGVFGRSTSSSRRYKNDISLVSIDELKGLYNLPVKKFKYNNDYIATDDELYGKYLYGFIVEDLEDILPCAVQHGTDENGNKLPEMWNSNIIVPSLLKLIQDLNNRLKVLEKGKQS